MSKMRVGLIIDDCPQSKFIWDFLKKNKNANFYSIELLIVQKTFRTNRSGLLNKVRNYINRRGLKKLFAAASFSLLESIEKIIVKRNPKFKDFYRKYNIDSSGIEQLKVTPKISKSGLVYRYSENDLKEIKNRNLDVLIRGGNGILRGGILDICKFGILSFHHGNNNVNRGGPAGFWEVYNREASTGFIIQQLKNELDGGDVVFKGDITTTFVYSLNVARLYSKANLFLSHLLEKVGRDNKLPEIYPKTPYSYPLYSTPSIKVQLKYIFNTFLHVGNKVIRKILQKSYRWGVAYQFVDDWKSAVLWKSKVIKNPPNRFLADPFIINRENKHVCFVEDYNYYEKKGRITAFKITKEGYEEIGVALEEKFHLSYPYLFEANGELFMCPETNESKDIRIYKCNQFPLKWSLHKIIMKDVSACDSNIFYHDNKWWLMTNIDSSNIGEHSSELHIFYSDHFDSDNWKSHPKNPVIFNSRKARNGGFLKNKNNIYRPYQIQGWDLYGESMGVAKIKILTTEDYQENEEFLISPNFFTNIKGVHSYNFNDGLLVFDFVKIDKHKR
tara:strand:+ start:2507 stop:4180 length:1674 start_codon:yes stop_codon:yes gene_type:complete